MARGKRIRRKVTVNKIPFLWYVRQKQDEELPLLRILSVDKKFILHYSLRQAHSRRMLTIVSGFHGDNSQIELPCPKFEEDNKVTPTNVENIIQWYFSRGAV